ncbi:TetR/AcrR family transcriptional regulator [Lichenifustis flavocetrariae]|uniref:TetR/AcrR family transcriptional regulator n=1 Tax=Lichenifustis flavocetrariae TaxID=2949735 RepID=A0AA41Z2K7_9HYPH|nr:TetR/AcrR family transcriptional regulator [Lichenifustis flavocetrariae]MCW6511655.1 TetR/AcrR family transcriptional regulator [Lichenifustis flavocetrariae]
MGRPREFDIADAIEKATLLFWRNGYEGTSISDLTKAIGISPPSFYFAFGSKEALFRKVIEWHDPHLIKLAEAAFRKTTPRAVAKHFLYGYADVLTDPLHAPGCLALNSSLPCVAGDPVKEWLAELRGQMRARFRDRFAEARGGEGLPAGMDAGSLARLVMVVAWGIAVEAQSGASRKELRRTIALALPAWPGVKESSG